MEEVQRKEAHTPSTEIAEIGSKEGSMVTDGEEQGPGVTQRPATPLKFQARHTRCANSLLASLRTYFLLLLLPLIIYLGVQALLNSQAAKYPHMVQDNEFDLDEVRFCLLPLCIYTF